MRRIIKHNRPSRHYRRVRTKHGRRRILINPYILQRRSRKGLHFIGNKGNKMTQDTKKSPLAGINEKTRLEVNKFDTLSSPSAYIDSLNASYTAGIIGDIKDYENSVTDLSRLRAKENQDLEKTHLLLGEQIRKRESEKNAVSDDEAKYKLERQISSRTKEVAELNTKLEENIFGRRAPETLDILDTKLGKSELTLKEKAQKLIALINSAPYSTPENEIIKKKTEDIIGNLDSRRKNAIDEIKAFSIKTENKKQFEQYQSGNEKGIPLEDLAWFSALDRINLPAKVGTQQTQKEMEAIQEAKKKIYDAKIKNLKETDQQKLIRDAQRKVNINTKKLKEITKKMGFNELLDGLATGKKIGDIQKENGKEGQKIDLKKLKKQTAENYKEIDRIHQQRGHLDKK
jgi:hypothetical protein